MEQILHIVPSYKPAFSYGGPTVSVARLAEEQARSGARVTVFTTTANGAGELPVQTGHCQDVDGVGVYYFKRLTGDHSHLSPALLWALWRDARLYPILHIHSWWNFVVFGSLFVCRLLRKRSIVSPHGMLSPYTMMPSKPRRWFQKTVGAWLLGNSILHATSELEKKELQALHPKLTILLAPNIIYLPVPPPPRTVHSSGPLQLLFLSRIDPKKGLDILLRALAPIHSPAWLLTIAGATGSAYQLQLLQLSKKLGLDARINWLGWTAGAEKWSLLEQSDLMILPSHNENFANVVLEALVVGAPVVVSDQVGLHAYVRKRNLGWVTQPDPDALRKTLLEAFSDVNRRKEISRTAPAFVLDDFEPQKVARLYFKHYATLRQTT